MGFSINFLALFAGGLHPNRHESIGRAVIPRRTDREPAGGQCSAVISLDHVAEAQVSFNVPPLPRRAQKEPIGRDERIPRPYLSFG